MSDYSEFGPSQTHDCSGAVLVEGVTNLTVHNVLEACHRFGIKTRDQLHIRLGIRAYDALERQNEIDHYSDGAMRWRRFTLSVEPSYDPKDNLSRSIISDPHGNKVLLITREGY